MKFLSRMSPLAILARILWTLILVFTMVFVFYSSANVSPALDMYGGLAGCIKCANGWNWHVLLMTIAFNVVMVEALLVVVDPTDTNSRHEFEPNFF
jgi:hypothetical protein